MLRHAKSYVWVVLGMTGFFVAGYLGLFEILIEFALVSWTSFATWRGRPTKPRGKSPGWFLALKAKLRFPEVKERLVKAALEGRSLKAAAVVALLGVVTGWVMVLGWLIFRDPLFVLTRELKETVVDLIVFTPFVLLLSRRLHEITLAGRKAAAKAWSEYSAEEAADDPRDPESFDIMLQWGRAQAQIAKAADPERSEAAARRGRALTLTILLTGLVLAPYAGGAVASKYFPIALLDRVAEWEISRDG